MSATYDWFEHFRDEIAKHDTDLAALLRGMEALTERVEALESWAGGAALRHPRLDHSPHSVKA